MKLFLKSASAVIAFLAVFFVFPKIVGASGQVVINEFFTDPAGEDKGFEWIELYNAGSESVDLDGWQIGAGKYFDLPAVSMPADSFLLIHWRADGQNTANEIFTGAATIDTNMGNSSGFVALFNSSERSKTTIVDYIEYGKAGQTWETAAADAGLWIKGQFLAATGENLGQSLGLKKDGQDTNLTDDWQIFSQPTPGQSNISTNINTDNQESSQQQTAETNQPSPETENSSTTQATLNNFSDKILINEFMPWPGSADEKEWVELLSQDSQIIDLSNWQIDDGPEASEPQKIPAGTLIEPNQFLVIKLNKDILNNAGDQARLIWPDGQILHTVSYQNAKQGFSSSRFENGLWLWTDNPTPGSENKKPTPKSPPLQTTQEKNIPLVVALSENVTESLASVSQKPSAPQKNTPVLANEQTTINQETNDSPAPETTQTPTPETQNSKTYKPFILLTAILLLGLATGIALVIFRRKKAVDPVEKPTTKYF